MSYIVRQKINDRIYLYEVTNRWDKKLKKTKQTRKYLGPEERVYKKRGDVIDSSDDKDNFVKSNIIKAKKSNFVSKSYGNIF